MKPSRIQHVGIGELKVGRGDAVLEANLGSCLGIAIGWSAGDVMGLAHVLLPKRLDTKDTRLARYADTAVAHLLRRMRIPRAEWRSLTAVLAGGASMYERGGHVGDDNVREGKRALREAGIRLVGRDVGGLLGRRIVVDCAAFQVQSLCMHGDHTEELSWTLRRRSRVA